MNTKKMPVKAGDSLCPNNLDLLLSRLEKVQKTGVGKYKAACPAHDDKTPSLAIKADGDKLLIHCFAGCDTADVLKAIDLDFTDIMPNQSSGNFPRDQKPFYATEILKLIKDEVMFVYFCALHMAKGFKLCDQDLNRLTTAATNIKKAFEVSQNGI